MKTAISVDDALMEEADQAARVLGLSRSGLIARALDEYLARRRHVQLTEELNKAYAAEPAAAERRAVKRLKTKLPVLDRW